jgi:A/G-specific adenine glycosylase
MASRYFSDKVVEWYQENHRKLPWRDTRDPYRIWLSEIILQQTRVAQGLPYYLRFVERYPTVNDLAAAREQDVLRLWQGLGYYTRARNMIKCARAVVATHGGSFPGALHELKKLPGIGEYTASAIASIAFEERVAVVDGNVYRVLARFFGIDQDISKLSVKRAFSQIANQLVTGNHPGIHNQAVMEFGALCCLPKAPRCHECVVSDKCFAMKSGRQAELPFKERKSVPRRRYFYYFVIVHKNRIAMKKRSGKDIWRNLYDFYLAETDRRQSVKVLLERDSMLKRITGSRARIEVSEMYRHTLSHQRILARFVTIHPLADKIGKIGDVRFFTRKGIDKLPKPALINRYLTDRKIL